MTIASAPAEHAGGPMVTPPKPRLGEAQLTTTADAALTALVGAGDHPLVQSFPHGALIVFDHDLRYLAAGGQGLADVGLSRAALEGKTIFEAFPVATAKAIEPLYRAALAGESATTDVPYAGRIFQQRLSPVFGAGGAVVAGMGFTQDVTLARAAEQLLRESEQRFRLAFDHAPIGMAVVDLDGGLREVNPALCRLLGYPKDELQALTFQDITHPDDLDADLEHLARLVQGETDSYQMEKRYTTASGQLLWALLAVTLVLAENGEPLHFISQIEDITDRKERDKAVREANEFQSAVLATSPDTIHVMRLGATRADWTNGSLTDLLGYTPEDLARLGDEALDHLIPDADRATFDAAAEQVRTLADGQTVQLRHRIRHADGGVRWISRRLTPFRRDALGEVTHLMGVSRDVTDLVVSEGRLEAAALHDDLTGLPNRRHLLQRLTGVLEVAGDGQAGVHAVLFCDLDGFKHVNDSHGHEAGDDVLVSAAARLVAAVRDGDIVARMGGDEFVVLVHAGPGEDLGEVAETVARRVCTSLAAPFTGPGAIQHRLSVSVGVALPGEGATAGGLLRDADAAMYTAKAAGKNRHAVHRPGRRPVDGAGHVRRARALPSTVATPVGRGGIGTFEWNPDTQVLSWDDTLAEIFRADRSDETPFQTWRRRVHPDDQERVIETFAQFREAEDLYRLVLDDGSIRHVLSRATQVEYDAEGTPSKMIGVMVDVTTAQEASARVTDLVESISDGFLSLNRDWRFSYVNARAEVLVGMTRDQLLGRNIWDLFPDALGTQFESAYTRVMYEGVTVRFEEFYPAPLEMWVEVNAQPSADGIVVYFQDVTARRVQDDEREKLLDAERRARLDAERTREDLAHQAAHDPLTGLINRSELRRRAQGCTADGPVTVLYVNLDRFKLVNDSLGHPVGDAVLFETARRLEQCAGPDDLVARLGGDEFAVLLVGADPEAAEATARRVLGVVRQPLQALGGTLSLTASVGLAAEELTDDWAFDTLLRDADVALDRAKGAGRDRIAWFDAQAHAELLQRIALEADLRAAIDAQDIVLHYQPVFSSHDLRLEGAEALARWTHPVRGPVAPMVFIALAEDCGLIDRLGEQVLAQACEQARAWAHLPDFRVWVNVSPLQMRTPGLSASVLEHLRRAGVPACRLGVEVTESALADETVTTAELAALAQAGVAIAIDDFGTGYSSLARLSALPLDVLKIDRSFVQQLHVPSGRAAVDAIVVLAHALGLRTVAEGIETDSELELLRELGSDAASGYLLGRPGPADQLPAARPGAGLMPRPDGGPTS